MFLNMPVTRSALHQFMIKETDLENFVYKQENKQM